MKILILRFLLIKIELELRDAGMDGVADEGIIITALYMGLGRLIFKFYKFYLIVNLVDVVMADEAELPPLSILVKISVS
jgi:hypothetical protein